MILEKKSLRSENSFIWKDMLAVQLVNTKSYPKNVLVVEDDIIVQYAHQRHLEELGCQVDVANNGLEAIKLARKNRYSLIFMDIGLPDLNGIEVSKAIRYNKNKSQDTPIIAITAHNVKEIRDKCLLVGVNKIITKPIAGDQFKELLKLYTVP